MNIKLSLAALFAAGAVMGTAVSANAADLGGDCCADLEERVADLEATTARKGNRKVSLTIYGQVNVALMHWDTGGDDDVYVVENDSSSTRLGFKGKAKINSDVSAGYRIELGVHSAESDRVDENNDDGDGNRIVIRRSAMFLASKTYGKVTWGHTGHAFYDTSKADLSGTHVVARNDGERYIEDFSLFNANGAVNAIADWNDIFPGDYDFSRQNVIRYDSPTLAGFVVSASWGEDDEYSAALRYAGEFGAIRVAAAFGYGRDRENDGNGRREAYDGSFSIMHTPTGLWVSASGGNREFVDSGDEEEFYQVKAGIQQKWNSLGKTTLYGEYLHTEIDDVDPLGVNANVTGAEGDLYGFGVVQKIDAAAMELYAGYRHYEADLTNGVAVQDAETVVVGSRIKF